MILTDNSEEKFKKVIEHSVLSSIQNNKVTLMNFLNTREQKIAEDVFSKEMYYNYVFFGGYSDAEYKRLLISPYSIKIDLCNVTILEIKYNKRYLTLYHRKVLGSVLNLGIKREVIGDILIGENSYIMVSKEISSFLLTEFKSISGVPIHLEEVPVIIGDFSPKYEEKTVTCASMRLDLVLSKMYNLTRSEAKEIVISGDVKINHEETINPSLILESLDTLSVNHRGRMKVLKIEGKTKKDKIRIVLGKLVN